MDRESLYAWILRLEDRLEMSTMYAMDITGEGPVRTVPIVQSREERARIFGQADGVLCRVLGVLHHSGALDGDDPDAAGDLAALMGTADEGMVVSEDSPIADLREWADRLERRLWLDQLPDQASKEASLGADDRITVLDRLEREAEAQASSLSS